MSRKVNKREGYYGPPRCSICGRFIKFAEFEGDEPKAITDFTPDTEFTSENVEWHHVACEERSDAVQD